MDNIVTGGCMCGSVRYAVRGPLRDVICCHCEQCRRSSGHFVAATACRKRYFHLTASDSLSWYRFIPRLRRGFCAHCGSSLFFEDIDGERISIAAGTLDRPQGLRIAAHIYAAEKGDYYCINDGAPISDAGDHAVKLPD
jgi:hypothetical protein